MEAEANSGTSTESDSTDSDNAVADFQPEEPTFFKASSESGDGLTADFLFAKKGKEWVYYEDLIHPRTGERNTMAKIIHRPLSPDKFEVERRIIPPFNVTVSDRSYLQLLRTPNTVQLATVNNGKVVSCEPLVYLGANAGDSWVMQNGDRYTLLGIEAFSRDRIAKITITNERNEHVQNGVKISIQTEISLEERYGLKTRALRVLNDGRPEQYPDLEMDRSSIKF